MFTSLSIPTTVITTTDMQQTIDIAEQAIRRIVNVVQAQVKFTHSSMALL